MVSPKRRSALRKSRHRAKKRNKTQNLSVEETEKIAKRKKLLDSVALSFKQSRPLKKINVLHKRRFAKEVIRLARKFPGEEIIVLDDGAGYGHFKKHLSARVNTLSGGRVKVRVISLDLNPKNKPDVLASTEELVRELGKNSVHMVVSTFGGVAFTNVSQSKALANISDVLKPGGFASILTPQKKEEVHAFGARDLFGETDLMKRFIEANPLSRDALRKSLNPRPNVSARIESEPGTQQEEKYEILTLQKRGGKTRKN